MKSLAYDDEWHRNAARQARNLHNPQRYWVHPNTLKFHNMPEYWEGADIAECQAQWKEGLLPQPPNLLKEVRGLQAEVKALNKKLARYTGIELKEARATEKTEVKQFRGFQV